jgi:hypothetical protein
VRWQVPGDGGSGTVDEEARRSRPTCGPSCCDLTRASCDAFSAMGRKMGWGFWGACRRTAKRVDHGHGYGHVCYDCGSVRGHEAGMDGSSGSDRLYLCACARARARGVVHRRDLDRGRALDQDEGAGDDGVCYQSDGEALEGATLRDRRASRLCQLEPVVLCHRYRRRLPWPSVGVVVVGAVACSPWLRPFEFCLVDSKCPHLSRAAGITIEEGGCSVHWRN